MAVPEHAGWRRPLFFGVCDFPKGLVGVLDREQKAADLPNRSALRLLTSVGLWNGTLAAVRCQVPGAGAGAGCYERLSASRVLPTAYCPKATVCASPRKAVGSRQKAVGSWQDAADSRQLTADS
jgi:hypothetical protein